MKATAVMHYGQRRSPGFLLFLRFKNEKIPAREAVLYEPHKFVKGPQEEGANVQTVAPSRCRKHAGYTDRTHFRTSVVNHTQTRQLNNQVRLKKKHIT